MGTFFGDEEEKEERDFEVYKGKETWCAECGRLFVPGDLVNLVRAANAEFLLCHRDPQSLDAIVGKPKCVGTWRRKHKSYPPLLLMFVGKSHDEA